MLSTQWDAIVIGAGPAGSLAARELAGQGLQVLLLDRAEFPRRKVCGCCLNGLALGTLNSVGLGQLVNEAGGVPLQQFRLAVQGRQSALPLPLGAALSREKFDLRLIEAAQQKGVTFVPKTKAQLGQLGKGFREVQTEAGTYRSKTVIVADGLNSQIANQEDNRTIIQAKSRIGGGTLIKDYPRFYEKGTIYMATGRQGYVGLVCLEDGRLDVAAAFDPVYVKQVGGLGVAAQQILARAGFPTINHLEDQNWKGTPPLTRSASKIAGERWFAIGDATGYVEPFTGEGMAWALASAVAVAPLVGGEWHSEKMEQWQRIHRQRIRSRQGICRLISWMLKSQGLSRLGMSLVTYSPKLIHPLVSRLNRPNPLPTLQG